VEGGERRGNQHPNQGRNPMRMSRISVKQLFHTFNHSVSLNLDGRITIIHGLNGLGKTTLLRMVKSLCDSRYFELLPIPFAELRLDFDDESSIVVTKTPDEDEEQSRKRRRLRIGRLKRNIEVDHYQPTVHIDPSSLATSLEWVERHIPGLSRVASNRWLQHSTGEVFSLEEIVERFSEYLPPGINLTQKSAPAWIEQLSESVNVRLIETQRLVTPRRIRRRAEHENETAIAPAIMMHSQELANRIGKQEKDYGALAQTLDRTFPIRYVQQKQKISLSEDALRTRFQEIEAKRARLEEAGLLGKEETGFEMPQHMDEADRGVLSVYVSDIERKLSVFDDLAARIDLFQEILNGHFQYKMIQIHKEKGFQFRSTRTREELNASDLSSGEQHEVVVLYELLFHVQKNSLVMIDEPEISLHIAWQEEFVRDLQRVIKLSPFDAVIATHSPQIVNDRWDLAVELTGPEENEE
jgi:predicted ATPase